MPGRHSFVFFQGECGGIIEVSVGGGGDAGALVKTGLESGVEKEHDDLIEESGVW